MFFSYACVDFLTLWPSVTIQKHALDVFAAREIVP